MDRSMMNDSMTIMFPMMVTSDVEPASKLNTTSCSTLEHKYNMSSANVDKPRRVTHMLHHSQTYTGHRSRIRYLRKKNSRIL